MSRHEFTTEILDELQQTQAIRAIVLFLAGRGVKNVQVEFGFVVERDYRGEPQGEDAVIPLRELESLVSEGIREGTIEWSGTSDFRFMPLGIDLDVTLCNDSDLHFSSDDVGLVLELSRIFSAHGVKVFGAGEAGPV